MFAALLFEAFLEGGLAENLQITIFTDLNFSFLSVRNLNFLYYLALGVLFFFKLSSHPTITSLDLPIPSPTQIYVISG